MADRRRTSRHSREMAPLYAVRVRSRKSNGRRLRKRFIKIALGGDRNRQWMLYARFLWLKNKGPIPKGQRVFHRDGDTLNDDLPNLFLGDASAATYLFHAGDPERSRRAYEKCGQACSEFNRLTYARRLATEVFDTRWYAVDFAGRKILNRPWRMRWQVYKAHGVHLDSLPHAQPTEWDAAALGWPGLGLLPALILDALIVPGELRNDRLREAVSIARQRIGRAAIPAQRFYTIMVELKRQELVYTRRGGSHAGRVRITDLGRKRRIGTCPYVPVRGQDLAALCPGFQRIEPEETKPFFQSLAEGAS
jgi:hypothetical protein